VFLQKLELFGFKSFAQRTQLRFAPGITAVVGPNGCGKSNISDAIRWALGEQNVRHLRGSQLEDVIFKGTREAKPMGMAEVALHLDNQGQQLATEFAEVTIERRAFRSGESEFTINKSACRLKDIRDLFMDTGLGGAQYAVIEREMIDEVLSDRDSARRFLLDEASGITRYKQRRKETLRKIEAVDADLVRVLDALQIEEREVRSLAYQMGRARRHQRLSEKIRELDVALAHRRWAELDATASGESGRLSEEERRREALKTDIHRLEAEQETVRLDRLELQRKIEAAHERLNQTATQLAGARQEALVRQERVRALRERIADLEQRTDRAREARDAAEAARAAAQPEVETLAADLERRRAAEQEAGSAWARADAALRDARRELQRLQQLQLDQVRRHSESDQRGRTLEARLADLGVRAEQAEAQRAFLSGKAAEVAGDLEQVRGRHARTAEADAAGAAEIRALRDEEVAARARLEETRERMTALAAEEARQESRIHLLEEQARAYEGYREGVAELLAHRDEVPGLLGVASELLSIDEAWGERLTPALRELTEWVVTESEAAAWHAIDWLRGRRLGQVTFLPLDGDAGGAWDAAGLPEGAVAARAPQAERLAAFVRRMLVPVADRIAVPPAGRREAGRLWVTDGGEVFSSAGWLSAGGHGSMEARLWRRPAEIVLLQERRGQLGREREEAAERRRELEAHLADRVARRAELEREGQERSTVLTNLARALAEREAEHRLMREEIARLAEEQERLAAHGRLLEQERVGTDEALARSAAEESTADAEVREAAARVEVLATEKDHAGRTLTERKMEAVWAETQLRDRRATLSQAEEEIRAASGQIAAMGEERSGAEREIVESETRIQALGEQEVSLLRQRESRSQEVDGLAQEATRTEDRLAGVEQQVRQKRRALSELEEVLRENEVRLARVEANKQRLRERIQEQHGVDLVAFGPADAPEAPLVELTPEAAEAKLQALRAERERLGPVNLLAIEEHQRKRDHVRFIQAQRDDLVRSKESLLAAIERINVEARRLFSETFSQVQGHFSRTFETLFPGGEARLDLIGDDPLEGDIEIMARPRGKRLENIRLLSSGERALTATSLLFGIYLVKPSPFCVLDELDAPLDDANIDRFLALLRTFSARTQFIVITHNKRTMEVADSLYGVTMQEPGISKIVSVRLEGGQLVGEDRAATEALIAGLGTS
jgi:chromosome segregation protein